MANITYGLDGITAQFKIITPDEAREILLHHNDKNRKLKKQVVSKVTLDMERGYFPVNGDTVRFAKDGTLVDGQNRLTAVVNSHKAQTFLVVYGLDYDKVMPTIDQQQATRSVRDTFQLMGVKQSMRVAAAIKAYVGFHKGKQISNPARYKSGTLFDGKTTNDFTYADYLSFYSSHKDTVDSIINFSNRCYKSCSEIMQESEISGRYLFLLIDKNHEESTIQGFFECLCKGINCGEGFSNLRNRIISDKHSTTPMTGKLRNAYICKAWANWLGGNTEKLVKIDAKKTYEMI